MQTIPEPMRLRLIMNWHAELERLVPTYQKNNVMQCSDIISCYCNTYMLHWKHLEESKCL